MQHGETLASAQSTDDLNAAIFSEPKDAIDVPMNAGDLIIGDARLLHAAWPNATQQRRTCILAWHDCFRFPQPPSWYASV